MVDLPLRESVQHLFERDPTFEASQRGTQAVVRAVAERDVLSDVAVDVERFGFSNRRSSRLADASMSSNALPAGTVLPWYSTASGT